MSLLRVSSALSDVFYVCQSAQIRPVKLTVNNGFSWCETLLFLPFDELISLENLG